MDQRQWAELLNLHADRLRAGADLTPEQVGSAAPDERGALESLLDVARRLHGVLVPVEPRTVFVAELRTQLAANAQAREAANVARQRRKRGWLLAAAGVGGVIYLFSLGVLVFRMLLAGRNLLSGIMSARAARPVLPKVQAAP